MVSTTSPRSRKKRVLTALENAGVFTSGLVKDKVLFCSTENGRMSFVRQLEPEWLERIHRLPPSPFFTCPPTVTSASEASRNPLPPSLLYHSTTERENILGNQKIPSKIKLLHQLTKTTRIWLNFSFQSFELL
ncbi:hypothetical protein L1887_05191 [Cichorium endivia]|nr:hypothetical protein L1887_05179 [Cichorium endivia]KAI3526028.1 hypothetical protein L1887_05183 [Cichorium endivia]KAI3526031.1 hypothetical protein L1887_05187 [Cichorium endivia]KAI3526034.1 hypothetical protein L1887_05191 [Cichorium endivia]